MHKQQNIEPFKSLGTTGR